MTVTKEKFFKQGRQTLQDKASATDTAAKQITATENADREKKTEKLRALRLAQPEAEPIKPATKRRHKTK
ncbi:MULTISPECIES: hypothetical protein [Rhizobium]|jgi:hypothetical protein|uniref:Uncharacterized protein n=1 Tax=Rhizobium tropici TaxID=398 RepID=A0A329Y9H5_RHITR|nr:MULTISPECIES: hypothetical protein [Rhizobium]MBB3286797.1 hypothetical protein [Rhizobium sp. BK252]MBB3401537.1 hypothetical protein [Rhizobium sp. BK289]MBB3414519.1 hypothetical protein [Rhizobium sp. BK284]MBB3482407.1 hypothetical protein [Rhizobium sp. BK347]MDK4718293.1 hypothetical protein [Rhizobium sp. CNPSo 3968]